MKNKISSELLVMVVCLFYTLSSSSSSPLDLQSVEEANSSKTTYCASEYSCVDCKQLRICAPTASGSFTLLDTISCAGDYSWCDPDTVSCVTEEPQACIATVAPTSLVPVPSMFTCMGNGYFPDLTDCSRYYMCAEYEPYLQQCSGTTPYYAFEYGSCYGDADYCANSTTYGVDCSDSNPNWYLGKQQLGSLGKYFYYCTGTNPEAVNSCYGAYRFNVATETCEPHCPHAGLFPSAEDCTEYYLCSPKSGDLYETEFTLTLDLVCPEDQAFSSEAFQCVDKSLVLNCD